MADNSYILNMEESFLMESFEIKDEIKMEIKDEIIEPFSDESGETDFKVSEIAHKNSCSNLWVRYFSF